MSALTDVIQHPATAAQELERLREGLVVALTEQNRLGERCHELAAEIERLRLENAQERTVADRLNSEANDLLIRLTDVRTENYQLEQRIARLEWVLRAIDCRLHNGAQHEVVFDPAGPQHVMVLPVEDFTQICRVIVAATGKRP